MEPQIRYTRTADGVSIAYWTLGSGPPLVYLPPMPQHVQLDWRYPPTRELYQWLVRRHQLVRYDHRGCGLSQRDAQESSETQLIDLETVVAQLDLEAFDLFAHGTSVGTAVRYTAKHPESVKKLVLVSPFAPFPESYAHPPVRALTAVLPVDHDMWTELLGYMTSGLQGGETARQYAALMRNSMTHEQRLRNAQATTPEVMDEFARCLPVIRAPTLIAYQDNAVLVPSSSPQRLAAEIADARLVRLEGEAVGGSFNDPLMMAAVDEFLMGEGAGGPTPALLPAGMAVILFVDVAGSTALTERMGDEAFRAASRSLDQDVRTAVRRHGGTAIEGKVMGDGVMGVFTSAAQAIVAARACHDLSAASELALHLGLHAGDVIREETNVYGGAVNIAARVCDASTPGEILVSATVRDLARTSAGVVFEDRGERTLKGIDDPVRVFAVLPKSRI